MSSCVCIVVPSGVKLNIHFFQFFIYTVTFMYVTHTVRLKNSLHYIIVIFDK